MEDKSTGGSKDAVPTAWRALLGEQSCDQAEELLVVAAQLGPYYPQGNVFRSLASMAPEHVRAVIIGQDPYHGAGEANGLAFSVDSGVPIPPSLRNIFKELQSDLGKPTIIGSGDLSKWAASGVLLLNALLTVMPNEAGSHSKIGWEPWTDHLIQRLSAANPNAVFILWGNYAKKKRRLLRDGAFVIEGAHPSPLSANRGGFFGGKFFSRTNELRAASNQSLIDWSLA